MKKQVWLKKTTTTTGDHEHFVFQSIFLDTKLSSIIMLILDFFCLLGFTSLDINLKISIKINILFVESVVIKGVLFRRCRKLILSFSLLISYFQVLSSADLHFNLCEFNSDLALNYSVSEGSST